MKFHINNETKIGILAVVALGLLILGFNFLKGRDLLDKSRKLHAVFHTVSGLATSNPVIINGLQVGTVYKMIEQNADLDSIIVTLNFTKEINIPVNSLAYINKDLLGTASLSIVLGNSETLTKNGDTLNTQVTSGLIDDVKASLNPALNNINGTLKSLDSVIEVIGTIFDPTIGFNIQKIVANLAASSISLQSLLNAQTGMLGKTLTNMNSITGNLAEQSIVINRTLSNLDTATGKFASLKLDETLATLNKTVNELHTVVSKAGSTDGSIGLLLNDKKLYQNLENTSRSLNILLDDLRVHPKRYVSISIFGKKEKGNYLTNTLIDSTNSGKK
ncbi:MAG: MlaD family protein [Chitinophagaceae bacterium]